MSLRWGAIPAAWIRGGTSKGALAALRHEMIFDALLALPICLHGN